MSAYTHPAVHDALERIVVHNQEIRANHPDGAGEPTVDEGAGAFLAAHDLGAAFAQAICDWVTDNVVLTVETYARCGYGEFTPRVLTEIARALRTLADALAEEAG